MAPVACSAALTPSRATARASSAAAAVCWARSALVEAAIDGLLGALAGGLDHPDLALGALRDVTDGVGDLADRAAGLIGRGRHLLGRRSDGRRVARDVADQRAELLAHVVVGLDRVLGLAEHLVERLGEPAELVGRVDLDRGRDRRDGDRQVALGAPRPGPSSRPARQWSLSERRRSPSAATGRTTDRVTTMANAAAAASPRQRHDEDQARAVGRGGLGGGHRGGGTLVDAASPGPRAASDERVGVRVDLVRVEVARAVAVLVLADRLARGTP